MVSEINLYKSYWDLSKICAGNTQDYCLNSSQQNDLDFLDKRPFDLEPVPEEDEGDLIEDFTAAEDTAQEVAAYLLAIRICYRLDLSLFLKISIS